VLLDLSDVARFPRPALFGNKFVDFGAQLRIFRGKILRDGMLGCELH